MMAGRLPRASRVRPGPSRLRRPGTPMWTPSLLMGTGCSSSTAAASSSAPEDAEEDLLRSALRAFEN
jgi:hypothetical protein